MEPGKVWRIAIVASVYAVYVASFPWLFPVIGMPLGAFAYVPIALVGTFFGRNAGLMAGLAVMPLGWWTYGGPSGNIVDSMKEPFQIIVVGSALLIGGLAGRMSDLTRSLGAHRAALTHSNRRFELVARTTGDIVWEMDLRGGKTWANEAFSTFVHGVVAVTPDSGPAFYGAVHPDDVAMVKALVQAGIKGAPGPIRMDFRMRRHDGQYREMEAHGVVVRDDDGDVRGIVGAIRDVTDRHAAERARHMETEHRLDLERAAKMDRFKTQLMNTASHELNTPISALKLQLHILRAQLRNGNVREVAEGFALLERNTDRLSALIIGTLDVAHIQSGKLALKPTDVDLHVILNDVVATYGPVAESDGLRLVASVPDELRVHVDPQRMTQVMTNLVGNAIKFTPNDGTVTISARPDGDGVVVEVRDTGLGMTEQQMSQLFQPFMRVHDVNVVKKGTGLGLYISKAIAEESGGRIWCESAGPDTGTTFHVRMPAAAQAVEASDLVVC